MQYFRFTITLIAVLFITTSQSKFKNDVTSKANEVDSESLVYRLDHVGVDLTQNAIFDIISPQRAKEHEFVDDAAQIAMGLKKVNTEKDRKRETINVVEKLKEKAIQATSGFKDGKKMDKSKNETISQENEIRRRLAYAIYMDDEEQILDGWLDGLSYNELLYYYNLLNDADYDSDYDDAYYGYYNEFDEEEFGSNNLMKESPPIACKKELTLKKEFDGLRKIHAEDNKCSIQCKDPVCGNEYVKPMKDVQSYSFMCKEKCEQSIIFLTGSKAGAMKWPGSAPTRASETITGRFGCVNNKCSPAFIGFYNFATAEIKGPKYPQETQINFKKVNNVNIAILNHGAAPKGFVPSDTTPEEITVQSVPGGSFKRKQTINKAILKKSQKAKKLLDWQKNHKIGETKKVNHFADKWAMFTGVAIYTEEVGSLTVNVDRKNSFKQILLDVRGVDGDVRINCNKQNACNQLVVRYQKERCGAKETIQINCVPKSCIGLELLHESFRDHFGRDKYGCGIFKKQTPVTPRVILSGVTINEEKIKSSKIIAESASIAERSTSCKMAISWYDKSVDINEGLYIIDEEKKICAMFSKNEKSNIHMIMKQRNRNKATSEKTKQIRRNTGNYGTKAAEVAQAGLDIGAASLALPVVAAALGAAAGGVGAGLGTTVAVIPLAWQAIDNLIYYSRNKNLRAFQIKWEDRKKN